MDTNASRRPSLTEPQTPTTAEPAIDPERGQLNLGDPIVNSIVIALRSIERGLAQSREELAA